MLFRLPRARTFLDLTFFYLSPLFFFICYHTLRDLHSFPTRRSSDLGVGDLLRRGLAPQRLPQELGRARSEEHTSELQSLTNLVCRLLLEKKNTTLAMSETKEGRDIHAERDHVIPTAHAITQRGGSMR